MNKRIKKKHWKQEETRELGKLLKDKRTLKRVVSTTARAHFGQKTSFNFDFWAILLLWVLFEGWGTKKEDEEKNECE